MLIKVSVSKANFVSEKLNRHNLLEDLNEHLYYHYIWSSWLEYV